MDDPRREGYLHQNGAAGLPTRSIRDFTSYVVFLSLLLDSATVLEILPQQYRTQPPCPTFLLFQFELSLCKPANIQTLRCCKARRAVRSATAPGQPRPFGKPIKNATQYQKCFYRKSILSTSKPPPYLSSPA